MCPHAEPLPLDSSHAGGMQVARLGTICLQAKCQKTRLNAGTFLDGLDLQYKMLVLVYKCGYEGRLLFSEYFAVCEMLLTCSATDNPH